MRFRALGQTGLTVSELSLGGGFLGSWPDEGRVTAADSFKRASQAVRRAVELGINYIDTAPTYGESEAIIGQILPPNAAAPMIISTKLGGRPEPFNPRDRAGLRRSFEESLRLLRRESIDILMVHEPDRPGFYDWWDDPVSFTGPVLDLLLELKAEGLVRYIGLGGTTVYELANLVRSGKFDVVLTAFNYSLLWREAEREIIPAAVERGMGIVVGSPLQQGALAQRYDDEVRSAPWLSAPRRAQMKALYQLLDETDLPLSELALRFVLSNSHVSCVLTGARSNDEVEENIRAAEKGPLPADLLKRLDDIAAMVPFRPFEEPSVLPFGQPYRGPGKARR